MSDDLIKRSDAIETLRKLGHEVVVIDKVCSLGVAGEFIDSIRTIPSADRPQGEWVWHEDEDICNCSRCNFEIDAEGCIDPIAYVKIYNFCPNCGAKMKGADDEAD